jgi:hypothetical protein
MVYVDLRRSQVTIYADLRRSSPTERGAVFSLIADVLHESMGALAAVLPEGEIPR